MMADLAPEGLECSAADRAALASRHGKFLAFPCPFPVGLTVVPRWESKVRATVPQPDWYMFALPTLDSSFRPMRSTTGSTLIDPSRRSQISNHGRKADSCRGFGLSLLARGCTQLRAHRKMADATRKRGQEPAFLALRVPLRYDNEASLSGFHACVTATTLESRPRRRYVATCNSPRAIHARCRTRHNRPARRLSSSTD